MITYLTIISKKHRSKLDKNFVEAVFESYSIKATCDHDDHCQPG